MRTHYMKSTLEDISQNTTIMTKDLEAAKLVKSLLGKKELKLYRGKGCNKCENGYKGRVGIFELLYMSERVSHAALEKLPASKIQQVAMEEGMMTLLQDGYLRALEGSTTLEEVVRVTK